ncbi:MAG: DUF3267 domain-containing protein [Bacteroidetes bacterium]|nr:DUF3267 domain-containing protein [Bacteroidota bacterium]
MSPQSPLPSIPETSIPDGLSTDGSVHGASVPDGFQRVDRSVSLLRANFLMVYFALPSVLVLGGMYVWLWGHERLIWQLTGGQYLMPVIILIAGILAHEGIHGLTWKITTGKPFGVISFGFHWKTLTPYAHCSESMEATPYRIGAVMPLVLLGIVPSLWAIAEGMPGMMLFGLFFTFAAGGDMLILWLLRDIPGTALVEDHPTRAGCYVLVVEEETTKAQKREEEHEEHESVDR